MEHFEVLINSNPELKTGYEFWKEYLEKYQRNSVVEYDHSLEGAGRYDIVECNFDNNIFNILYDKICRQSKFNFYLVLQSALNIVLRSINPEKEFVIQTHNVTSKKIKDNAFLCIKPILNKGTVKELLLNVREEVNKTNKYFELLQLPEFVEKGFDSKSSVFFGLKNLNDCDYNRDIIDIAFIFKVLNNKISLSVEYNSDRYDVLRIQNIAGYLTNVLNQFATDINTDVSEINILPKEESLKQLETFNSTYKELPREQTVVEMFKDQVRRNPKDLAVKYEGVEISYEVLDKMSDIVGYEITKRISENSNVVGIIIEPSHYLVISILAVLKSGNTFLAIDNTTPIDRKNYLIKNSSVKLLITDNSLPEDIHIKEECLNISELDYSEHKFINYEITSLCSLAYILYTSGSTGLPKGVQISHSALYNYIFWANEAYIKGERLNMALFTSISFDLTITSLFLPLISGNTLTVYNPENNEFLLEKVLKENVAEVLKLTPSHLFLLLEKDLELSHIKRLVIGGEQLKENLAYQAFIKSGRQVEIYNEYGPTEATVGCMLYQYNPYRDRNRTNVLIGKPTSNNKIYILDEKLQLIPIGSYGELYIGGDQLFNGYVSLKEKTEECLIDNPYQKNEKIYKTGDIARWHINGEIEFNGRRDNQVKINGYRIELGEIEHVIKGYDNVRDAIVVLNENSTDKYLIAYILTTEAHFVESELKNYLREKVSENLIPRYFMVIDVIPLTKNGKVDYKNLPKPSIGGTQKYIDPTNSTERKLQNIWAELLSVDEKSLGIGVSFFELGGNSFLLVRLVTMVKKVFGVEISVTDIFKYSNIRELARHIVGHESSTDVEDSYLKELKENKINIINKRKSREDY